MSESNSEEKIDIKRDDLIFDLIKRRFDSEIERRNNLDGKASNLIGFISIVVGLLLSTGTIEIATLKLELSLLVFYFVGIGLLLISIGLALCSFRVRSWIVVPNVQTLINKYTNVDFGEVLKRIAGEMAKAVIYSEKQNDDKAKLIEWSWYLLISGLTVMFIFIISYITMAVAK
jgi:hypothetical protein